MKRSLGGHLVRGSGDSCLIARRSRCLDSLSRIALSHSRGQGSRPLSSTIKVRSGGPFCFWLRAGSGVNNG